MIQGNYSFEDLVRVDCNLPPRDFLVSVVHEAAHFTLAKQTTFGLLCFFLSQDCDYGGQALQSTLRLLERASECCNECYARTMELLWGYKITELSSEERASVMARQRRQDHYRRYHMDQLDTILINCEEEFKTKVFPHDLFIMSLNIDIGPLIEAGLSNTQHILRLLQQYPERFNPDHRFIMLTQAYRDLRLEFPPALIDPGMLCEKCGISYVHDTFYTFRDQLLQMAASDVFRRQTRKLMEENFAYLTNYLRKPDAVHGIEMSMRLSVTDCVIPFCLGKVFDYVQSSYR